MSSNGNHPIQFWFKGMSWSIKLDWLIDRFIDWLINLRLPSQVHKRRVERIRPSLGRVWCARSVNRFGWKLWSARDGTRLANPDHQHTGAANPWSGIRRAPGLRHGQTPRAIRRGEGMKYVTMDLTPDSFVSWCFWVFCFLHVFAKLRRYVLQLLGRARKGLTLCLYE